MRKVRDKRKPLKLKLQVEKQIEGDHEDKKAYSASVIACVVSMRNRRLTWGSSGFTASDSDFASAALDDVSMCSIYKRKQHHSNI
jgi:hypothetical protein